MCWNNGSLGRQISGLLQPQTLLLAAGQGPRPLQLSRLLPAAGTDQDKLDQSLAQAQRGPRQSLQSSRCGHAL